MTRTRPFTLAATGAAIALTAFAVASCGGSNNNSSNAPAASAGQPSQAAIPAQTQPAKPAQNASPTPKPSPPPQAAPAPQPSQSSNGIPQGDVGDNDADNHGGPDDGDGGI